ncbi:MAG: glycosyltransferase [Desulfobacteraceae bacterium]|nr:MAG: glycosyltransferase [Desulfobacteraceae bacterium]
MQSETNRITVCICTFKRPQMLSNLLSKLQYQVTENLFTYSAVVVDNDTNQSARETVNTWQDKSAIQIDYYFESEQNIALARNKAVENATGNFIAFIDDDELPTGSWLLNLYKTLMKHSVDAVLGPVKPHYPEMTPDWLIKSKLCERPEHKTGTILHWGQTRTGNVILNKRLFENKNLWFDPAFGKTGGEDTIFFKKHHENGKTFVWCNEAVVYETVPPERCTKIFHIRKNLRIGCGVGENLRKQEAEFCPTDRKKNNRGLRNRIIILLSQLFLLCKSFIWIILTVIPLPLVVFCGKAYYVRFLAKLSYNFGVISGFFGFVVIRYRS